MIVVEPILYAVNVVFTSCQSSDMVSTHHPWISGSLLVVVTTLSSDPLYCKIGKWVYRNALEHILNLQLKHINLTS